MATAKKDDNLINTMTGVLNTDGITITRIKINATTHILDVSDGTTGSDLGADNAVRDDNIVPVLIATSETDGSTPVQLYVDSNGKLLVDST